MSKIDEAFRIEWDLHELGPRPKPQPAPRLHGPTDARLHALAVAIAAGDVPPNSPVLTKGKAA